MYYIQTCFHQPTLLLSKCSLTRCTATFTSQNNIITSIAHYKPYTIWFVLKSSYFICITFSPNCVWCICMTLKICFSKAHMLTRYSRCIHLEMWIFLFLNLFIWTVLQFQAVLFYFYFSSIQLYFHFYCILLKKSPAISNHTSVSSQLSSSLLYVDSHSSSQSLNTHTPPSVSLSVIGSETDLIVWTSVSQTGHKLLYLWLLCLLLAGIY